MSTSFDRLPKGSLVLVTGATGYIGSAVVDVLLERGFRVRATTRSAAKAALFTQHFTKKFPSAGVEFVAFSDYASPEGYGKVLENIDGVLHLATDTSFGNSYEQVVEQSTAASLAILKASSRFPKVKSIVSTSSVVAAFNPEDGKEFTLGQNSYNAVAEIARSIDPSDPKAGGALYAASKVESERQAWAYIREAKPHYTFNTVLPAMVFGPDYRPEHSTSTAAWLNELFAGDREGVASAFLVQGTPFVDVRDIAGLHVAALLDTNTEGQRLWGMPQKVGVNDILAVWRTRFPDKAIVDDYTSVKRPRFLADETESDRLISGWQSGWTDWKKTVVENVESA